MRRAHGRRPATARAAASMPRVGSSSRTRSGEPARMAARAARWRCAGAQVARVAVGQTGQSHGLQQLVGRFIAAGTRRRVSATSARTVGRWSKRPRVLRQVGGPAVGPPDGARQSGSSSPAIVRSSVVLPEPLGPGDGHDLAAGAGQVHARQDGLARRVRRTRRATPRRVRRPRLVARGGRRPTAGDPRGRPVRAAGGAGRRQPRRAHAPAEPLDPPRALSSRDGARPPRQRDRAAIRSRQAAPEPRPRRPDRAGRWARPAPRRLRPQDQDGRQLPRAAAPRRRVSRAAGRATASIPRAASASSTRSCICRPGQAEVLEAESDLALHRPVDRLCLHVLEDQPGPTAPAAGSGSRNGSSPATRARPEMRPPWNCGTRPSKSRSSVDLPPPELPATSVSPGSIVRSISRSDGLVLARVAVA